MYAVNGIYDGQEFKVNQPIPYRDGKYDVVITFLHRSEENEKSIPKSTSEEKARKLAILRGLSGIIPADVDENAVKAERLARQ